MKAFVLFLPACFFTLLSFSQNLERTGDFSQFFGVGDFLADLKFVEVTSQGEILVAGNSTFGQWEPGFFVLNQAGDQVAKNLLGLEVGEVIDFHEMPNGDFVFTAYGGLCDVCCASIASKFDSNWNLIWQLDWWNNPTPLFTYAEGTATGKVVGLSNNHLIFVETPTKLTERDEAGEVVWAKEYPYSFFDIVRYSGDTSLAATSAGLVKLDAQGNELAVFPNYDFVEIQINPAGYVAGVKGTNVTILNPQLEVVSSKPIPGSGGFDLNNQYFVRQTQADESLIFSVYDTSLNHLGSYDWEADELYSKDLALGENEVYVAGNEAYFDGSAAFVKSFAFDGATTNYGADAGVAVQKIVGDIGWFGGWLFVDTTIVTLKNFGTALLDVVTINVRFQEAAGICYFPQISSKTFYDLNLAPGDSVSLTFGEIQAYYWQPVTSVQLCFWTYAPNIHTDKNHENDWNCQPYIVNDAGETTTILPIHLFPNPAADVLTLQLPKPFSQISDLDIVNPIGQVVWTRQLNSGETEMELEIADLPNGIYWLRLENGSQVFISKFIKH